MFKQRLRIVCYLFTSGVLLVVFLFARSSKPNTSKNSFNRLFDLHTLDSMRKYDLGFNSYYIAGLSSSEIYLGNFTAPDKLFKTDYNLSKLIEIRLDIPGLTNHLEGAIRLSVDSPDIFITDGYYPSIMKASLPGQRLKEFKLSKGFNAISNISEAQFAIRTYDRKEKKNILGKVSIETGDLKYSYDALQKQIDGFFCEDGTLLYNDQLHYIIYTYFYRNQFVCLDTNMNIILRGKTIDTVTTAKIKVDSIKSKNQVSLTSPSAVVNKFSCTSGKRLFINSMLMADNEEISVFNKNSVVDVYSIVDGHYEFSFYVPSYDSQKLSDLRIFSDKLVMIAGHQLITYQLTLPH